MYCGFEKPCSAKAGYMHLDREVEGGDLWVCAQCQRPTKMVMERLTDMYAPKRATQMLSTTHDAEGRVIIRWATPESGERITTISFLPYPRKADMPAQPGRALLVKFWHELDSEIDVIRSPNPPQDGLSIDERKVRASTLAWMLAEIMAPFYATGNDVLAESMARWTARQNDTEHESPGLAEHLWDPTSRFDGTPYSRANEERARNGGARTITPAKLDEQKTAFVKHALETGAMKPEGLASMFGVSIEVIRAAVDS
jgi:hypothetical protein